MIGEHRNRGKGDSMGKKILLADDSLTIQKVVELTFSDTDFEVAATEDGRATRVLVTPSPTPQDQITG
jgi:CheY-like chemotaxis protein